MIVYDLYVYVYHTELLYSFVIKFFNSRLHFISVTMA